MRVHHLNLCTMCPFGGRLIDGGDGSILSHGEMIIHALLVETESGLVLVDTGMGLEDIKKPKSRLGRGFLFWTSPRLREQDTAIRQVEALGFSPRDVKHIVVTHLDVDHAGGIPDFPGAQVHVHRAEHEAAMKRATLNERERYRKVHWAHDPKWELHEVDGERWFGFESVRAVADDVYLIPLPGHTRGHCAVAVRAPSDAKVEWFLHCGDAYFHASEKEDPSACPMGLKTFQRVMAVDDERRRANAARLRELHAKEQGKVRLFSAHSPQEYRECVSASIVANSRPRSAGVPAAT